jgi:hypothetical protein
VKPERSRFYALRCLYPSKVEISSMPVKLMGP